MEKNKIAIVGSGLIGRILALTLLTETQKINIDLYDKDKKDGKKSCGYQAAGMLAPIAELTSCHDGIFDFGCDSVLLWEDLLAKLPNHPLKEKIIQKNGTIILSHPYDGNDLNYLIEKLTEKFSYKNNHKLQDPSFFILEKNKLQQLEPELEKDLFYQKIIHCPNEAVINVALFYQYSQEILEKHPQINWKTQEEIIKIQSNDLYFKDQKKSYDAIFDCRGLGAKKDLNQFFHLYPIRGEALVIDCPSVHFNHTLRLIHPRHSLYLIPRGEGIFYLGATSILASDTSAISVESMMTLLSMLYMIDKRFSEARIIKTISHCRPSSNHDLPIIQSDLSVIRLNGLSRHGYLFAPKVAKQASKLLKALNEKQKQKNEVSL